MSHIYHMAHINLRNLPLFYNLGHYFYHQKVHSIRLHTFSIPFCNQLLMALLWAAIYQLVYDNLLGIVGKQILHYFDNAHHSK